MFIYKAQNYINPNENITIQKYMTFGEEKSHKHNFIEILYICYGTGIHEINESTFTIHRGDLILIDIGDIHSFYSQNNMGIINCLISPEFFNIKSVDYKGISDIFVLESFKVFDKKIKEIKQKISFTGKEFAEIESLLSSMYREYSSKDLGYMETLKNYINVLLLKILRISYKNAKENNCSLEDTICSEAIEYIHCNYNKKINMFEIAEKSHYNPYYFSQLFKEQTGKTFTEYIQNERIKKALDLIYGTNMTIEQICYAVGYNDKKQFYKKFKEHIGLTPGEYRNKIQKNTTNL